MWNHICIVRFSKLIYDGIRGDSYEIDRFSSQPLTILGVTGPFSVLAENIYSLCIDSFHVSEVTFSKGIIAELSPGRFPPSNGLVFNPRWLDALPSRHL